MNIDYKTLPSFPDMSGTIIYAIGDIHGYYKTLLVLMAAIRADVAAYYPGLMIKIIFLGDYIDRGPHSCQVIDYVKTLQDVDTSVDLISGNHESYFKILDPLQPSQAWLVDGGAATLKSYKNERGELDADLIREHQAFFKKNTIPFRRLGNCRFEHGDKCWPGAPLRIHGHSVSSKIQDGRYIPEIWVMDGETSIGIDTGMQIPENRDDGIIPCLTAVVLQHDTVPRYIQVERSCKRLHVLTL